MTTQDRTTRDTGDPARHSAPRHSGHGWMMIICCIPMLIAAFALVATGVINPGFLLFAAICVGTMVMLMRVIDRGGGGQHS